MRLRGLLIAGLLLVIVTAAAVLMLRRGNRASDDRQSEKGSAYQWAPSPAAPTPPGARASRSRVGARTLVPRLLTSVRADAGAGPRSVAPVRLERGAGGPPRDRRPDAGGSAPMKIHEIQTRFRELDAAVERCLSRFAEEDPALAAGVMLAFTLDADGLQEVWIVDHEDVSDGPLTCLSHAVYEIDWSGLTRDPVQATRRMRARRDGDAGTSSGVGNAR